MRIFPTMTSRDPRHETGDEDMNLGNAVEGVFSASQSQTKREAMMDQRRDGDYNHNRNMNLSNEQDKQAQEHDKSKTWFQRMSSTFIGSSFGSRPKDQNRHQKPRIHPYALYPNEDLSPRSSLWLYLSATSLAGLSTLLVMENPIDNNDVQRNKQDTLLLSILSVSFGLAFLVAMCFRHRSLRDWLTRDILPTLHISLEFLMALVLFILWCIELRYVMDPFSGVEYGLTMTKEKWGYLYYEDVWNGNLWVSSWLGGGIASFLVGELIMAPADKRCGVVVRDHKDMVAYTSRLNEAAGAEDVDYIRTYVLDDDGPTYWFLLLVTSCALSAFCIDNRNGLSCEGSLSSTPFCKRSLLGSIVGMLSAIISICALIVHYFNQRGKIDDFRNLLQKRLWMIEVFLSAVSFVLNCINVGYATSPGGPGNEIGNVFVSCWLGVIISTILFLRTEKGWTIRATSTGDEKFHGDEYVNDMMDDADRIIGQYHRERYPCGKDDGEMDNVNPSMPPKTRRVFISKAPSSHRSSRSDSSSSSSDNDSSSSAMSPLNTKCIHRLDTSGERTSGERTSSTYSLPAPPPICLDSSPDDPTASRPSLSNTIPAATTKSAPPPPYNAYGFSYGYHYPMNKSDELSIEEDADDDEESAIEICIEPDDVSSLGISMLSLDRPSTVDPDGYKSEDNYVPSPSMITRKANTSISNKDQSTALPSARRASRQQRLMSDDLPTVEEQSLGTQSKLALDSADSEEVIMNLGNKPKRESFLRSDSEGANSSVGPQTVDASSVSYIGTATI
ncbi:hypothetical protein HJC23_000893 [Cyclotella cryptica]|uniref:Uncharacterized protein n=1 Tax=Cyclotella cryptica TaxID=29204 RepID=A0ABD3PU94_9STRA|eukprot:CCRYP_011611-RA/>CCRYP_011611-RA protein AED:0.24 eAED:0.24 QI:0/-1/0/1/-1/1/1/0/784